MTNIATSSGPLGARAPAPVALNPPIGVAAGDGFELGELFAILRRRALVIVVAILVVTGLAAAYVFTATPLYTAETMVTLDMRRTEVVASPAILSGLPIDSAAVRSEVELLRSPAFAQKVVRELGLLDNARFMAGVAGENGRAGALGRLKSLFAAIGLGGTPAHAVPSAAEKLYAATDTVRTHASIANDGRSYAITISYDDRDPALAAQIVNGYASIYVRDQLEAKTEALHKANAWLTEQLATLSQKVRDSARAVQLFRTEHALTQTKDGTVMDQQLTALNERLTAAQADRTQKEATLLQVQALKRQGDDGAIPEVLSSPLIEHLREQEALVIQRRADLSAQYGNKYPAITSADNELRNLRGKIGREANKIVNGMANDVAAAKARETALGTELSSLQQRAVQGSDATVQLQELEREAEANRNLYQDLLLRSKQTAAQEDIQQPDAHIVGQAEAPLVPSHPRKLLIVSMSFIAALLLGFFLAFLADSLDTVFRSSDQVRRLIRMPMIGLVPDVRGGGGKATDAVLDRPVSVFSESIHTIRARLSLNHADRPQMISVTSAVASEGKTLVATALARSLARSGIRTLLLDCDLRRPRVGAMLGRAAAEGLHSEPCGWGGDASVVIYEDGRSGLDFAPAPRVACNPQEVLGSAAMRDFLAQARSRYDVIILDTPPVLAVSDALVVSRLVDATVLVIRWARTPQAAVRGALELLQAHGAPVVGAILSCVNLRKIAKSGKGEWGYHYAARRSLWRSVLNTNAY